MQRKRAEEDRANGDNAIPPGGGIPVPAGLRALGRYLGARLGRNQSHGAMDRIERQLLQRLDAGLQRVRAEAAEPPTLAPEAAPRRKLQRLLDVGARQSPEDARERLYGALVDRLTSEEACMLAALADGEPRPVLHVHAAGLLGGDEQVVARWISDLGHSPGVQLGGMAARYLAHLENLALVEELVDHRPDAEAKARLAALPPAATALAAVRQQGLRPRLRYSGVVLSTLGAELWQACAP